MFLSMAQEGQSYRIKKVCGREKVQKQLNSRGFVNDACPRVAGSINQNLIVLIKQTRVGLGKDLAQKIIVDKIEETENLEDLADVHENNEDLLFINHIQGTGEI